MSLLQQHYIAKNATRKKNNRNSAKPGRFNKLSQGAGYDKHERKQYKIINPAVMKERSRDQPEHINKEEYKNKIYAKRPCFFQKQKA